MYKKHKIDSMKPKTKPKYFSNEVMENCSGSSNSEKDFSTDIHDDIFCSLLENISIFSCNIN